MSKKRAEIIAVHLDCTLVNEPLDTLRAGRFKLQDQDGRKFCLSFAPFGNTERIGVTGDWPVIIGEDTYEAQWPADILEHSPVITMTTHKTNSAVAKDIEKRFLPDFIRIYELLVERGKRQQALAKSELEDKQLIAQAYGKSLSKHDLAPGNALYLSDFSHGYLREARVYDGKVSASISGIPVAVFVNLVAQLKAYKGEDS